MASRTEQRVVYAAGVVQSIALVTFPAASTIFTDPSEYALSSRQYARRFWVYACFAVLYGICETVNGNWSQLDMTSELGASTTQAALALTAF